MKTNNRFLRLVSGFFALVALPLSLHAVPRDNPASSVLAQLNDSSSRGQNFIFTPASGQERLKNTFLTDVSMKVSCQIAADGSVQSISVLRRGRDRDLNARMLASAGKLHFAPHYVAGVAVAHEEVFTIAPDEKK